MLWKNWHWNHHDWGYMRDVGKQKGGIIKLGMHGICWRAGGYRGEVRDTSRSPIQWEGRWPPGSKEHVSRIIGTVRTNVVQWSPGLRVHYEHLVAAPRYRQILSPNAHTKSSLNGNRGIGLGWHFEQAGTSKALMWLPNLDSGQENCHRRAYA